MHRSQELFVISDLHIGGQMGQGGERGSCINTHLDELTQFVLAVAERSRTASRRVELVINGDVLDFLAEEVPSGQPWSAFINDQTEALQAFIGIRARAAHFFDALRALLHAGGDLTLVLGNHDLELSLPAVRSELLRDLHTRGNGRVAFVYDGEAHVVGDVLIEHGNRYDGFNVVDFDRLRAHRSALSRRAPMDDGWIFEPPAGSRLVESVMNPIKRDWGFVDLLKPENEAVIPLLVALEPTLASNIERLWRLTRIGARAALNTSATAGEPAWASQINTAGAASQAKGSMLHELLAGSMGAADLAALQALAGQADDSAAPAAAVGTADNMRLAWSLWRLKVSATDWDRRMDVLLAALRRLQHDRSFDTGWEDDALKQHVVALGRRGFAVVVLGHTHLAREMTPVAGLTYLNTGTWADLIRLPDGLFDTDKRAARLALDIFVDDLRERRYEPYIRFEPGFAHILLDAQGHAVSARLHRYAAGKQLP